jgi:hypothetical protein
MTCFIDLDISLKLNIIKLSNPALEEHLNEGYEV